LFILLFLHMSVIGNVTAGKKQQVLMIILKAFNQYMLDIHNTKVSCLDSSIQLRAVAFLIRETVPFPLGVDLMSKCFLLNEVTDPQPFIVLIRQILERKDYLKVGF